MCQQSFPSLRKVVGSENFADWLKWAQSLLGEFELQQLDKGLKTLIDKVGMASVQQAYRKRLKKVKRASIHPVTAYDIASQRTVEVKESPQLTQLEGKASAEPKFRQIGKSANRQVGRPLLNFCQ